MSADNLWDRGATTRRVDCPAYVDALARLAREGQMGGHMGWRSARAAAAPVASPESLEKVKAALLDGKGAMRLAILEILAWAESREQWRKQVEELLSFPGLSADDRAGRLR